TKAQVIGLGFLRRVHRSAVPGHTVVTTRGAVRLATRWRAFEAGMVATTASPQRCRADTARAPRRTRRLAPILRRPGHGFGSATGFPVAHVRFQRRIALRCPPESSLQTLGRL